MPDDTSVQAANHVVAVAVLILHEGRVLSMRRSPNKDAGPGLWETLSGRVEPGEQPYDGAVREAFEESGMRVRVEARPWTAYAARRAGEPMVVITYRAVPVGRNPTVVMSKEHDAFAWLDAEAFAARCRLTALVPAVETALAAPPPRFAS